LLPLKINKPGVYSLSGRVLAYHMWELGFHPQHCKNKQISNKWSEHKNLE
jgi:hypothetical protein